MSAPLPDVEQAKLLLDQVDQRMRNQREEWDGLDRKATTILATCGVLLGLVVNNADALRATAAPGPWVFLFALMALVVALGAGVVALLPRRFSDVPDPKPFLEHYAPATPTQTMATLASTKADEYGKNAEKVRSKLWAVRAQMALVLIAAALLAVALAIPEVS